MIKKCVLCQLELEMDATNFYARKTAKDGFRNECKICLGKKHKANYLKNKDAIAEKGREYRGKNKGVISDRGKRYREENKELLKERYQNNKDKHQKQAKKYWSKHRERLIEQNKQWKIENKEKVEAYKKRNADRNREQERARYRTPEGKKKAQMIRNKYFSTKRLLRNDLTLGEWEHCLKFFSNECAYCGGKEGTLEQDHFVPVSKGGEFTKSNIVPACRSCNASKGNRMFAAWFKDRDSYMPEREKRTIEYIQSEVEEENDSLQVHGLRNQQGTQNVDDCSG